MPLQIERLQIRLLKCSVKNVVKHQKYQAGRGKSNVAILLRVPQLSEIHHPPLFNHPVYLVKINNYLSLHMEVTLRLPTLVAKLRWLLALNWVKKQKKIIVVKGNIRVKTNWKKNSLSFAQTQKKKEVFLTQFWSWICWASPHCQLSNCSFHNGSPWLFPRQPTFPPNFQALQQLRRLSEKH